MTSIVLDGLTRRFDQTTAVDDVSLTIPAGELFFVLGPSGCGKTTLLRLIAGFVEPDAGRIRFGDRDVTAVAPNKRNTGMVFQSYALWPHMTVLDNVAYGLRVRRVASAERSERARAALRAVHMEALAGRKPAQLSGGEQQRVALARALVVEPQVLLLDEPLSNLDAVLRQEMRHEIRRLCRETRITTVYVTHDQKEALSMADTIAVLRNGRVAQVGTPRDLYASPCSRFVAGFLGETNFLEARIVEVRNGLTRLQTPAGTLTSTSAAGAAGDHVICSIRPESARLDAGTADTNRLTGRLVATTYLGELVQHQLELEGGTLFKVLELGSAARRVPAKVSVGIDPANIAIVHD